MSVRSTEKYAVPDIVVQQLASAMRRRYHTAMLDGTGEQAAFEEMIRTVLETYREAMGS